MALTIQQAKAKIDAILNGYAQATTGSPVGILGTLTPGKVYEAWVLVEVLKHLNTNEGLAVQMTVGTMVVLNSTPQPINPVYTHFQLSGGQQPMELWTDVEFTTQSFAQKQQPGPPQYADKHELDLVVVPSGTTGHPLPDQVLLGVEAKHTPYRKSMLRELLGVRRELSLLAGPTGTAFNTWPAASLPADPASCLLAYCSHPNINNYRGPDGVFGFRLIHLPVP